MSTTTVSDRAPPKPDRSDFLPIGVDTITASTELTFDLYLRVDPAAPPILYRERQLALEPNDFTRLSEQGTTTLYIRVADHTAYRDYLIDTVLRNKDVPAPRRFQILKIANRAVFQSAFGNRNPAKLVGFASEYADVFWFSATLSLGVLELAS